MKYGPLTAFDTDSFGVRVTTRADTIILFGGLSSERHVSVASAQHLCSIVTKGELWFWAQDEISCYRSGI